MFWGLIMEPNKRYTQTVERAFHISMASLDGTRANAGLVQVMICYDNRNYLLCTLQKGSIWQVPLDLNFQEGTKIAFTCNGESHVHLTGYLVPEEDGFDEMDEDDFDEEDAEDDEEIPTLVGPKKRKAETSPKEVNGKKLVKKSKVEVNEDDDDETDSDDEENGFGFDEDDSDDDLDGMEDEDDDDNEDEDDDDGDEEDDDEDEEDDEEEEEEQVPVTLTKKQLKQQKQQQNQQKQQNQPKEQNQQNQSKKGKEKLVNGQEGKQPEKEQGKQKKNKEASKAEEKSEQQQPKRRTVEGGVQVEDLKVGEGAPAKSGKFVSVYYIGRLKNGKKFDQTQQGEGFKFRLGKGEVIKGWDVGIAGMKVGGKRRLTIPPNMAYGAKGSPPVIPPNSQLNFEVELKAIH